MRLTGLKPPIKIFLNVFINLLLLLGLNGLFKNQTSILNGNTNKLVVFELTLVMCYVKNNDHNGSIFFFFFFLSSSLTVLS